MRIEITECENRRVRFHNELRMQHAEKALICLLPMHQQPAAQLARDRYLRLALRVDTKTEKYRINFIFNL